MKITTERAESIREVWAVDDGLAGASDADLLDAIAASTAGPIEGTRLAGEWVVIDRGEDRIEAAAEAFREATAARDRAAERARALLDVATNNGYSEARIADMFGVDRGTVRRWRGK